MNGEKAATSETDLNIDVMVGITCLSYLDFTYSFAEVETRGLRGDEQV